MTKRERYLTTRLIDFLEEELGVVEYRPTVLFFQSSKKMLKRWLDKDTEKRSKRAARP